MVDHRSHHLVCVQDPMESARANTYKLGGETRAAIAAIREALDSVQKTSEGVEIRAHQSAAEVRTLIRR